MEILLAEEHGRVRRALRVLLEHRSGWSVIGEARNAVELLAQLQLRKPDLILLDWSLPGLTEVGSVAGLRGNRHQRYVVIALSGRPELRESALQAGANAFVSKIDPPDKLLEAIELAYAAEMVRNEGGQS